MANLNAKGSIVIFFFLLSDCFVNPSNYSQLSIYLLSLLTFLLNILQHFIFVKHASMLYPIFVCLFVYAPEYLGKEYLEPKSLPGALDYSLKCVLLKTAFLRQLFQWLVTLLHSVHCQNTKHYYRNERAVLILEHDQILCSNQRASMTKIVEAD